MTEYTQNFQAAIEIVLEHEGGYIHDLDDPGGETKFGISKRSYPDIFIYSLTKEDAVEIYWRDYWLPYKFDQFPFWLALISFDAVVNQGSSSIGWLQLVLGVKPDYKVGPKTIAAANSAEIMNHGTRFLAKRALVYAKTKNFHKFGDGWIGRLFNVGMTAISSQLETQKEEL